jgi:hypothetical protein
VNIVGGLSVSVGTGVKLSRKLDSSTEYAYNNSQSISYTWGAFTGEVSHTNGGFTREGDLSLWYVDKYRRIMTGSLTYSF